MRANADGTSTVYIGGIYEATYDAGGALTGTTKYYQAFGRTIAMRSSSVAACASTLHFLLADHLGSTVGMTDNSGNVLSTQKYWPYGTTRSGGVTQTDKLYTGQQVEPGDSALGLYNYKARFYSTTLGRFASVDPVAGSVGDPQAWNSYSYVRNNPLRYTDPTGKKTDSQLDVEREEYYEKKATALCPHDGVSAEVRKAFVEELFEEITLDATGHPEGDAAPGIRRFDCHRRSLRAGGIWSGRLDSNQRPPDPQSGALPGCATPRLLKLETAPDLKVLAAQGSNPI